MNKAWEEVFDQIYNILVDAKNDVEIILNERKQKGEIKDIRQAMKSIAGNTFSNAIMYVFLKNKIIGNIIHTFLLLVKNHKSKILKILQLFMLMEKLKNLILILLFLLKKKMTMSINV